ncbi:MICOS complex subunit 26/27 [Arctopsyche grandis]|uniref:MICOS complex subunit 26/27 n=1 Tax=Arctopsyche grandis TaxID=121162 RepID=UPI00406D8B8F
MFARKIFSGSSSYILGPPAIMLAATPIIKSQETPDTQDDSNKIVCRPSELPVYPTNMSTVNKVKIEETNELEKILLEPISTVRVGVISALKEVKGLTTKTGDYVSESADKFNFVVAYLREEDNEAQRVGAVAMGALTGLIFGLRGGFFKKVTYTLVGTGTMGAICFPEQTNKYASEGVAQGKLLTNIIYNFVYGVKPGDPQPEINFPEISIPKNFDDLISLVGNVGKSAKNVIMPPTASPLEASTKPEETKK